MRRLLWRILLGRRLLVLLLLLRLRILLLLRLRILLLLLWLRLRILLVCLGRWLRARLLLLRIHFHISPLLPSDKDQIKACVFIDFASGTKNAKGR